ANTITTVLIQAAVARQGSSDPDQAGLTGIETAARRAMEEIQAMLRLMPREAEALGPGLADLPDLLAVAASAGLDVRVTSLGTPRPLTQATELAVYRAIQEGVTNALKYAPAGAACEVELRWGATELLVTVLDQGTAPDSTPAESARTAVSLAGPDASPEAPPPQPNPFRGNDRNLPPTGGRGLAGLAARVATLGGKVEAGTVGRGFRLATSLPVLPA
ncbi:MAG: ATP-binding protein, partial [Micropruina sp.]